MRKILTSVSYPTVLEDGVILASPEITLEPAAPSHIKEVYPLIDRNREFLSQFLPWAATTTKENLTSFIESSVNDFINERARVYYIRVTNSILKKQIVGCVSLNSLHKNPKPGRADLGYYLFSEFTGNGYMHEAVQALCAVTYTHDQVERFEIRPRKDNAASRNVALKLNAKYEGELRNVHGHDCILYAYILPDDFIQQNSYINRTLCEEQGQGLSIEPFDIRFTRETQIDAISNHNLALDLKDIAAKTAAMELAEQVKEKNLSAAQESLQQQVIAHAEQLVEQLQAKAATQNLNSTSEEFETQVSVFEENEFQPETNSAESTSLLSTEQEIVQETVAEKDSPATPTEQDEATNTSTSSLATSANSSTSLAANNDVSTATESTETTSAVTESNTQKNSTVQSAQEINLANSSISANNYASHSSTPAKAQIPSDSSTTSEQ